LDAKKPEIKELLAKGVHKTSICRMYDCAPTTLYTWMEANGLQRFVKSDKPVKNKGKKEKEEAKYGLKVLKEEKKK
jgi:hypothetical protein